LSPIQQAQVEHGHRAKGRPDDAHAVHEDVTCGSRGGIGGWADHSFDWTLEHRTIIKELLRKQGARTIEALWQAIGDICNLFTAKECWNFFRHDGYVTEFT
jgi:hypothetical protein